MGTYVCANDFWHPVVLAKEAATLDLLSEGRLEFGPGAGYLPFDDTSSGIPLDAPGIRISRLAEVIQIIKGLCGDGPVTYYTVTDLEGLPKLYQRPSPPLFIDGRGRRLLSLAAREADIVGLIPTPQGEWLDFTQASTAAARQRVDIVRQAAGERFDSLELNTLVFDVIVINRREGVAEERATAWGTTAEHLGDSVHFLVGTVEQIAEDIQRWREEVGISYGAVFGVAMEDFAPIVARLAGT